MAKRYRAPKEPPPDLRLTLSYLANAQPNTKQLGQPGAAARRIAAVKALHNLYLQWLRGLDEVLKGLNWEEHQEAVNGLRAAYVAKGAPQNFDLLLRQYFDRISRIIWTSPDPLAAMSVFWSSSPKRGRRPADEHRDLTIVADIDELRVGGMPVTAAYLKVGGGRPGTPGDKQVQRIYLRLRDEVHAELELRRLLTKTADDPRPKIEGQKITQAQQAEYQALAAAECPGGMTLADSLELWSFVRRASFPYFPYKTTEPGPRINRQARRRIKSRPK